MTKQLTRSAPLMSVLILSLLAVALGGCQKTPEERVEGLRSYYTARLMNFIVDAAPLPEAASEDEMPAEGTEGAEGAEGEMPGEMEMAAEPVPVRQDVKLDILVQHDSAEKLPGITIDIDMVDSDEQPKQSWKLWVDTADLPKATGHQFVHQLEDVDYEEGDGFSVEVRTPIPPEERGDYREFSETLGS